MERFLKRSSDNKPTESESCSATSGSKADDEPATVVSNDVSVNVKKTRTFKFGDNWKIGRPWLLFQDAKMYCSYCQQFNAKLNTKNKFVTGCESLRLENVRSHENSSDHKVSCVAFLNSKKPLIEQPIIKAVINLEKHDMDMMRILFNTAFFIGKHEKPFTDFVKLTELQNKNYANEKIKCKITDHYNSDKQARTFIHYIAQAEQEHTLNIINHSEFIAAALDGSTDSANLEEESFFLSYLDVDYEPHIDFVKMTSVEDRATAKGLTDCFFKTFTELGIDVKSCCVQLATDGPSVMKNMCALIKNEIKWVLQMHCVNHRLELAFKDAVKNIRLQTDTHELLDGLHRFYGNSSLQSRMLKATADLLDIKVLVHPTPKGTRWVAHRERALLALDRNYAANVAQLHECNQDNTQRLETRTKAIGLRDKLLDQNLVIFMLAILKPLLSIFSCLSCLLQGDDVSIDTFMSTIRRTKEKLRDFDCETLINEFKENNIDNGIFRDVQLKHKRTGGRNVDLENVVKVQSENLVKQLKTAISDRLGDLADSTGPCPQTAAFTVFDVSKLPDCSDDDISVYGESEIRVLKEHFSELLSAKGYDPDKIEDERATLWEYTSHAVRATTKGGKTIKRFWPKILRKKGDSEDLRNILALVKILLVVVFSTACVERGFSLMKRVKSDWRATLSQDSLNELMLISLSSATVSSFDPDQAIKLWWLDSKMPRRLMDAYGPRQGDSEDSPELAES